MGPGVHAWSHACLTAHEVHCIVLLLRETGNLYCAQRRVMRGRVRWDEMGGARTRMSSYLRRGAEFGRQLLAVPAPRGVELDQPEAEAGECGGGAKQCEQSVHVAKQESEEDYEDTPNTYFGESCTIEAPPFVVSSVTCSSSA